MGKKRTEAQVAALRERLARDGSVEFGVVPAKVLAHLAVYGLVISVAVAIGRAWGPVGTVLAALFVAYFVAVVVASLSEQLRGVGPALRVDAGGLTVRRWHQPLALPWADVIAVVPYRDSRLVGPLVALVIPAEVWTNYRAARGRWQQRFDRLTHYNRMLVLFKALDAPARAIVAFLDEATIDRFTGVPSVPHLEVEPGLEGHGPLWFRNGREALLSDLRLTPSLRDSLVAWNVRGEELASAAEQADPSVDAQIPGYINEGRSLAAHTQAELGGGATVRLLFDGE